MDSSNQPIQDLFLKKELSIRALRVCEYANLTSLEEIISYFNAHGRFDQLPRCGLKTSLEIEFLCRKYLAIVTSKQENINANPAEIYDTWTDSEKAELERFYDAKVEKMRGRTKTVLKVHKNVMGISGFLAMLFAPNFQFINLNFVGRSSLEELERFKKEIADFIYSHS